MLVLVGESASGKSTIEKILCDCYDMKRTISYTTREPRANETDGVDYHFISETEFLKKMDEGFFAETGLYNGWHYGTSVEDCTDDKVAVLTPHGLRQLKRNSRITIISFYIKVPRRDRLIRALERNTDIEEIKRRDASDVGQFDGIEDEVDFVLDNQDVYKCAAFVMSWYKKSVKNRTTKKKLTILCDIDEVVNNLVEKILKAYNKKYNDNVKFHDITDYKIHQFLKPEVKNVFEEFMTYNFLFSLAVPEGAIEVINELMQNHNFFFITTTHPAYINNKHAWLEHHFKYYDRKMLIMCKDKSLVHGDILIDDCADNINDNVRLNLIYDKPWNRKYERHNMKRVFNWNDIKDAIDNF